MGWAVSDNKSNTTLQPLMAGPPSTADLKLADQMAENSIEKKIVYFITEYYLPGRGNILFWPIQTRVDIRSISS